MEGKKLRIPLAWLQLSYDKRRLLAAVSGIVFAVALMLIQMGFRDALYLAAIQIHSRLNGDLFLLSSQYQYIVATKPFSQRHLYQTLTFPGVEAIVPVYLSLATWENPDTQQEMSIFVIGYDPRDDALLIPEVRTNQNRLALPEMVLFDAGSKPEFGPVQKRMESGEGFRTEVSGRRIEVGGLFKLGISFAADGNLVTSDHNFLRMLPYRREGLIDLGILRLKPGVNPEEVRAAIAPMVPPELQLITKQEYLDYEMGYWAKRTPIGFVFNLGVFVGFIVGAVIVYQILYTDVTDHLGEYATLKAMGYSDRYLTGVVLRESIFLCLVGFVPGWLISAGVGIFTRKMTLLPLFMTWERALTVLLLTGGMCVVSGLLAVRKLQSADPADIF
jgi:putative ABC transport system permease protein